MPVKQNLRDEQIWLAVGSLMILALVAVAFGLSYTRGVMIPFVLAVFVTTMVAPIVDFQVVRFKFPRAVAVGVALLFVLTLLAGVSLILVAAIQAVVSTAAQYSDSFTNLGGKLLEKMEASNLAVFDIDETRILRQLQATLPSVVTQTVGTATGLLSNGFLIVIFVVFLLAGRNSEVARTGIYAEIETKIRGYLATKFAISAVTGVLVWAILALFGLEMAELFGMLAFLLNFIPSIGSVIATLLPIPVAVAQFPGDPWKILAVVALPGTVHMLIGNVIEPKLMGQGLQLHPVTVLLSLAFWGLLWGPIGMILAVPITSIIRIILIRFDVTRPLGAMLAGELPGSAVGSRR